MDERAARRYLRGAVRLSSQQVALAMFAARQTGRVDVLWPEDDRRPGVTDVRATVTFDRRDLTFSSGGRRGWEVHRPGFAHGFASYHYLDEGHPADCERCYCRHYRHDGRSDVVIGDPPSTCRCGHLCVRHRWRVIRDYIQVCREPDTWFTEDMRTFNALANL